MKHAEIALSGWPCLKYPSSEAIDAPENDKTLQFYNSSSWSRQIKRSLQNNEQFKEQMGPKLE